MNTRNEKLTYSSGRLMCVIGGAVLPSISSSTVAFGSGTTTTNRPSSTQCSQQCETITFCLNRHDLVGSMLTERDFLLMIFNFIDDGHRCRHHDARCRRVIDPHAQERRDAHQSSHAPDEQTKICLFSFESEHPPMPSTRSQTISSTIQRSSARTASDDVANERTPSHEPRPYCPRTVL